MSPEERANDVMRGWLAAFDGAATGGAQIREFIAAAIRAAVAEEREACAKVCEATQAELDAKHSPDGCTDGAAVAADRIRSRPA